MLDQVFSGLLRSSKLEVFVQINLYQQYLARQIFHFKIKMHENDTALQLY